MYHNIFIVIIIVILVCTTSCKKDLSGLDLDDQVIQEIDTLSVLFIGSSYFSYNNQLSLFENLAIRSGKQVIIGDQVTKGYLADHASSSSTENKINERDWNFVVLQGVGSLTAYPEYYTHHLVFPALETLQAKISANCESTKMVFCMPWAFEDGMTWVPGWTDNYTDMQLKIYNKTLQWADSLDFVVSPVGWSWNTVLFEKNFPLHYLHIRDWNHPSLKGSYLMACTIFSTVYQQSTVGIPYYGGLTKSEAEYFQVIASNTVINNLATWNIK